jgi:hypothetical protein
MMTTDEYQIRFSYPMDMQQRRHPREAVKWIARLHIGQSIVTGSVRDWSEGGLCFEPEVGYIDGAFSQGQAILSEFDVGDQVEISLVDSDGKARAVAGNVRWTGRSQAHKCPAVGIEKA